MKRKTPSSALLSVGLHASASVRAVAPRVHQDAFHQALGTRPGDGMWREPARQLRIW